MKKITLTLLLCSFIYQIKAQCTIDPFIQQNHILDAQLLVLREIKQNPSDPDRTNPFLTQSRVDEYAEKLSALYTNPQNIIDVDSIFNEFQFHVNKYDLAYKKMFFELPTSVSWVQTFKDTGQSGITALDDFMSQYQFSISDYWDSSSGRTSFVLITAFDILNTYALVDDLQNTTTDITSVQDNYIDYSLFCNYNGIPYTVEEYALPPTDLPVTYCNIWKSSNSTAAEDIFVFYMGRCFQGGTYIPNYRYVTISNDCSTVSYSRTLSNENFELTNVSIYPNPASNSIHIQGIDNIQTVEIHSILGKKMQVSIFNSQIDISRLKSGVYFLKVTDDQNRSVIKKFIKK